MIKWNVWKKHEMFDIYQYQYFIFEFLWLKPFRNCQNVEKHCNRNRTNDEIFSSNTFKSRRWISLFSFQCFSWTWEYWPRRYSTKKQNHDRDNSLRDFEKRDETNKILWKQFFNTKMCVNVCLIIFNLFNFWINSDSYKILFNLKNLFRVFKFVIRDQKINNFRKNFFHKSIRKIRRKIFVLHELNDSSKIQLTIEFAQKSQKTFSLIFWLNDKNKKNLRQNFVQIDRQLFKNQISNSCEKFFETFSEELNKIINNILIWFNQHANNQWFFIFDNVNRDNNSEVNDLESYDMKDFFSKINHDFILITSRLRQL